MAKPKSVGTWPPPGPFTCSACGQRFQHYQTAERHVDQEHSGARVEFDVTRKPSGDAA